MFMATAADRPRDDVWRNLPCSGKEGHTKVIFIVIWLITNRYERLGYLFARSRIVIAANRRYSSTKISIIDFECGLSYPHCGG